MSLRLILSQLCYPHSFFETCSNIDPWVEAAILTSPADATTLLVINAIP